MGVNNISIKSIGFDADKKLVSFIEGRINKLTLFFEGIIGAEVFLKVNKAQNLENKVISIKIQFNS